jgi:hypothetical protein
MPSPTEARFGVNPILEGIIYGYKNDEFIGGEIFPNFPMKWDAGTVPLIGGKESMRRHTATWAPGAGPNYYGFGVTQLAITKNYQRANVKIPKQLEEQWGASGMAPATYAYQMAAEIITHELECAQAAVAMAAASYAAGQSQNAGAAWAAAGYGLLAQIATQKQVMALACGKEPNVFWCGRDVWEGGIKSNTGVQVAATLAKFGPGGGGAAAAPEMVTKETFAALIGVDKVIVGSGKVASDATPPVVAYIWADTAGLAYVPPSTRVLLEPPFGFTFRGDGYPRETNWWSNEYQSTIYDVIDNAGAQIIPTAAGGTTTESGYLWTNCI